MNKIIHLLLALLLSGFLTPGISVAKEYPYKIMGVVDRIDTATGEIIIGDMFYRLSPNVTIRDSKNRLVKSNKVQQGKKIGANSYGGGSEQYIHEIRLLPDNFDLSSISQDDD